MRINFSHSRLKATRAGLVIIAASTTPDESTQKKGSGRKTRGEAKARGTTLLLPTELSSATRGALQAKAELHAYQAKDLATISVDETSGQSIRTVTVLGIGQSFPLRTSDHDKRFLKLQHYRRCGLSLYDMAKRAKASEVAFDCSALELSDSDLREAFLEGVFLGGYSFERYKSKRSKPFAIKLLTLHNAPALQRAEVRRAETLAEATFLARDLVNTTARDCTTRELAASAQRVGSASRLGVKVFGKKQLQAMGCGGIIAVGQGSDSPPFLVKLTYKPRKKAKKVLALVGKGVTFDSGGYNLKPTGSIETMKCDMSGAAAVIGAMAAIGRLKPNVEVRAYIPIVENMVSGNAIRPGDIFTSLSGKTVEILNTDAEGRLILADALTLAEREKPDAIVDLATLTGACVVALGEEYAGLYANDESLAGNLEAAATASGERLWRLPLAPEYRESIKGTLADIRNHAGRWGGSITAALFLQEFVTTSAWAHLDIAGPAFLEGARGIAPKGGVGFGVRTLLRLAERMG